MADQGTNQPPNHPWAVPPRATDGWPTAPPPYPPAYSPPGPPLATDPTLTAGPPFASAAGSTPYGAGGFPPAPPGPTGRAKGRRGGVAVLAVLAVLAVFAAGVGGVLVGKELGANDATVSSTKGPVNGQTVSTVPGPVPSNATEPIAAVAAALSPAVVQIETGTGLGSGFIYDKSGLILTAAHVVEGATSVDVRFGDGISAKGTVLGSDPNTDVAVVKIATRADLPVAVLATNVDIQVGQTAVAIGSPFGLDQTVTAGIVSAIGRSTGTPGQRAIPAIQTDAPINSGNSGGALADRQGRVIGVNDSIITGNSQASGNVGVGFAIPIDIAKAMADRIVAGQSTDGGYMGIRSSDSTGSQPGAVIVEVEPGSPAASAGLGRSDVVTSVNGEPVTSAIDLVAAVTPLEPGQKITLVVERNGKGRSVELTLGVAPSN